MKIYKEITVAVIMVSLLAAFYFTTKSEFIKPGMKKADVLETLKTQPDSLVIANDGTETLYIHDNNAWNGKAPYEKHVLVFKNDVLLKIAK